MGNKPKSTRASTEEEQPKRTARTAKGRAFCTLPVVAPRQLPAGVVGTRARAIFENEKKWLNGTVLHYCFYRTQKWKGTAAEEEVVRNAFQEWKDLGIGLDFREIQSPSEAEIRIGFERGDGAWSYVGRDILDVGQSDRTMNFGWNIAGDRDTALHEIGHALGMPHEHQNPHAGIVWNEEAVYAALAAPPNEWDRETTFHNIIRKIHPSQVTGSRWDPNSIMHYPFEAGLIIEPAEYKDGLNPAGGLSADDIAWMRATYPPINPAKHVALKPFGSQRLAIPPGQQVDFVLAPDATREYVIQTFGGSDTVMALFEDVEGTPRFVAGDDDSGTATNAKLTVRLRPERRYTLRIRLYYEDVAGETAVMMW